jgi:hypothetical protein
MSMISVTVVDTAGIESRALGATRGGRLASTNRPCLGTTTANEVGSLSRPTHTRPSPSMTGLAGLRAASESQARAQVRLR